MGWQQLRYGQDIKYFRTFIEHLSFKAFNEGIRLKDCIRMQLKLMNARARCVVADSIYMENAVQMINNIWNRTLKAYEMNFTVRIRRGHQFFPEWHVLTDNYVGKQPPFIIKMAYEVIVLYLLYMPSCFWGHLMNIPCCLVLIYVYPA